MKKYYLVEEKNSCNGGNQYKTYEEAIADVNRILHEEANYKYYANKDHHYTLYEVESKNGINGEGSDEDVYTELLSCSVADYYDMSLEEKQKIGLNY